MHLPQITMSRPWKVNLGNVKSVVEASTSTIERAIAALVKAGKIEHRGSKKTGGYYLVEK